MRTTRTLVLNVGGHSSTDLLRANSKLRRSERGEFSHYEFLEIWGMIEASQALKGRHGEAHLEVGKNSFSQVSYHQQEYGISVWPMWTPCSSQFCSMSGDHPSLSLQVLGILHLFLPGSPLIF